jgi:hypothetical protein
VHGRRPGGWRGFAVDASLIEADANKQRSVPGHEWTIEDIPADATRAVKDYLKAASEISPKFRAVYAILKREVCRALSCESPSELSTMLSIKS